MHPQLIHSFIHSWQTPELVALGLILALVVGFALGVAVAWSIARQAFAGFVRLSVDEIARGEAYFATLPPRHEPDGEVKEPQFVLDPASSLGKTLQQLREAQDRAPTPGQPDPSGPVSAPRRRCRPCELLKRLFAGAGAESSEASDFRRGRGHG